MVIALRTKCLAALGATSDAGNMPLNLRGYDLLLQACKQSFAFSYRQSHGCRRNFLCPLDHAHLVLDWAAWNHLNYQPDCPSHPQRLNHPTTLHTLSNSLIGTLA